MGRGQLQSMNRQKKLRRLFSSKKTQMLPWKKKLPTIFAWKMCTRSFKMCMYFWFLWFILKYVMAYVVYFYTIISLCCVSAPPITLSVVRHCVWCLCCAAESSNPPRERMAKEAHTFMGRRLWATTCWSIQTGKQINHNLPCISPFFYTTRYSYTGFLVHWTEKCMHGSKLNYKSDLTILGFW